MTEGSALKQNAGAHTRHGAADLVSGLVSGVVRRWLLLELNKIQVTENSKHRTRYICDRLMRDNYAQKSLRHYRAYDHTFCQ